jgi:hypothetical protein
MFLWLEWIGLLDGWKSESFYHIILCNYFNIFTLQLLALLSICWFLAFSGSLNKISKINSNFKYFDYSNKKRYFLVLFWIIAAGTTNCKLWGEDPSFNSRKENF